MKKVNISLVGGQPMPVYVGIEATKPDVVILIHSEQSKEDASTIAKENGRSTGLMLFPDADYPDMEIKTRAILDHYKDDKVFVNISGGLKPWAMAFAKFSFPRENVVLFYINQNNQFVDINSGKVDYLHLNLDIKTILRFNHQRTSNSSNITCYGVEDFNAMEKLYEIKKRRPADFYVLTGNSGWTSEKITGGEMRTYRKTGATLLIYRKENKVVFSGFCKNGLPYEYIISSPNICELIVNARWFEIEVAYTLSKWSAAREVWTNVKFPYINGSAKNEIDVLVCDGTKLLFVECKTQIYDITDIDKFRTAFKTYGGTASKALFVTDTKEIKPEVLQKCRDHKIMTLCIC